MSDYLSWPPSTRLRRREIRKIHSVWRNNMLNRVSVNAILKSVIATLAAVVVVMLALGAWSSWDRLAAVKRIAAVADASSFMFTAMHNLRNDRTSTPRELRSDKQLTAMNPIIREKRDAEMPALRSALVALESVDLPDRAAVVADLAQRVKRLAALQTTRAGEHGGFVNGRDEARSRLGMPPFRCGRDRL
jgi:hypothetical protein